MIGVILYFWSNKTFLFFSSFKKNNFIESSSKINNLIKNVKLFYTKSDSSQTKDVDVLWTCKEDLNLKTIISKWLLHAYEDRFIESAISVESLALDESLQTVFISFSQNPISSDWSVSRKFFVFESLCKTIREFSKIIYVQFLVSSQIINDDHLDLSSPWPVYGFV